MQGSSELCHIKKRSGLIIIFLRSRRYHEEANYNLLMIFRSEWTKLKYTLNLVRCFLLHSTKFQYFFMDSKVNCQIHMITDVQYFIKECFWSAKKYFTHAVLSFSSTRYAIIARLKVIYKKSRHTMVTQLNKIWRVWACARATVRHSRPGLQSEWRIEIN